MTPRFIVTAITLALVSVMHADDNTFVAPKGTYTITQQYAEAWDATLHFRDASLGDAPLAADPDRYPWSATYLISPDDEWILRLQKTGSGENSALLYHVDSNGQVWRLEQHLDDLAFAVATAGTHFTRSDYYHMGVNLVSWDTASGRRRLKIRASAEDRANPSIDQKVVHDLRKHRMAAE
jgi:hypothetical protein